MSESPLHTRGPRRTFVLALVLLGLAGILASSVIYRLSGQPLTRNAAIPAGENGVQAGLPQGMNMPPAATANGTSPEQAAMIERMRALQANPNDVDALLELADLFMQQNNMESAQGFISRALTAAPSDPRPSYYQGVLDTRLGRYAKGAEALERSLRLEDSPATRYSLAVVYRYHLNDAAKAREHLEAAARSSGLSPELKKLIDAELAQ